MAQSQSQLQSQSQSQSQSPTDTVEGAVHSMRAFQLVLKVAIELGCIEMARLANDKVKTEDEDEKSAIQGTIRQIVELVDTARAIITGPYDL